MSKRYRVYREHKYVLGFLAGLEQFIATMDFRSNAQLNELSTKIEGLIALMQRHAEHEDKAIHPLLKDKGSEIQTQVEIEHRLHKQIFASLKQKLVCIKNCANPDKRVNLGYDFYLSFREFEADNLKHFNEEERIIMPELQRLYSDEQLRTHIDFKTYQIMQPNEMLHMLETLFPTYNLDDKITFLKDILESQPDKFKIIWSEVSDKLLTDDEKVEVANMLGLHTSIM